MRLPWQKLELLGECAKNPWWTSPMSRRIPRCQRVIGLQHAVYAESVCDSAYGCSGEQHMPAPIRAVQQTLCCCHPELTTSCCQVPYTVLDHCDAQLLQAGVRGTGRPNQSEALLWPAQHPLRRSGTR
jgi:hypothetical protein